MNYTNLLITNFRKLKSNLLEYFRPIFTHISEENCAFNTIY